MKSSGSADLPLYSGAIPPWLFERMTELGLAITEAILLEHGSTGFISRMSDPFWFQSFGAVMGMDWNSSGVTTSVMAALKRAINPRAESLGLYICGGKGKHSRHTPQELLRVGDQTGLDGHLLGRQSKLTAKVDNTAILDGFNLYLHSFVVDRVGAWTVIQQGMKPETGTARRYHWHSAHVQSFVNEPHTSILGIPEGTIINTVDQQASDAREAMVQFTQESPERMLREVRQLKLPAHCDVKASDINHKRLAALLMTTREHPPEDFEQLLLTPGVGPRTVQSLALVSEVIYGKPSRFSDPARFSFAHGGKSSRPFPVPLKTYDETLSTLKAAVNRAKIGQTDKQKALQKLSKLTEKAEQQVILGDDPEKGFYQAIQRENRESWQYGGMTPKGNVQPPPPQQLNLFDQEP